MTIDFDNDEATIGDGEVALEPDDDSANQPARRRSPLRIILLLLIVIILACAACFFGLRTFGGGLLAGLPFDIPGITPGQVDTPAPIPVVDTPALAPTEVGQVPAEETGESVPATEEPVPTDEGQLPATEEPVEEPAAEPVEEPTTAPTTAPVPGPTSTPAPTVVVTVDSCDNNVPPTADANGPYTAMMGKGQAIVTFDGSGSDDSDGTIVRYEWDFGDGSPAETGQNVTHGYTGSGTFEATLTVTDNCDATGQDTAEVTIVGPTPPPSDNSTSTPPANPEPTPASATMGFCYRVQWGDTLSGIAWHYGLPLRDLAAVNGVSMEYFVIAGQGLFIPTDEIETGPNIYLVQAGDTLNNIAYHCGLTVTTLATANGLDANANLTPGQMMIIPPWRQVNP